MIRDHDKKQILIYNNNLNVNNGYADYYLLNISQKDRRLTWSSQLLSFLFSYIPAYLYCLLGLRIVEYPMRLRWERWRIKIWMRQVHIYLTEQTWLF